MKDTALHMITALATLTVAGTAALFGADFWLLAYVIALAQVFSLVWAYNALREAAGDLRMHVDLVGGRLTFAIRCSRCRAGALLTRAGVEDVPLPPGWVAVSGLPVCATCVARGWADG